MRGATNLFDRAFVLFFISIHTPHAGSDGMPRTIYRPSSNFNPHSPCGERRDCDQDILCHGQISIHTPHAGSDVIALRLRWCNAISIHTPHAGSDPRGRMHRRPVLYFNPHSPCGERPFVMAKALLDFSFQSTLPMRGATVYQTSITGI